MHHKIIFSFSLRLFLFAPQAHGCPAHAADCHDKAQAGQGPVASLGQSGAVYSEGHNVCAHAAAVIVHPAAEPVAILLGLCFQGVGGGTGVLAGHKALAVIPVHIPLVVQVFPCGLHGELCPLTCTYDGILRLLYYCYAGAAA